MKYIDDINLFKSNKDFVAEIDMTGSLGRIYHYPQRMEGCLFLLCLRGECDITIHLSEHKIQKNDIVTILPETFVHVHRQSPDCRLYLIGFNKELLNGINLFNSTMNYLSALIDTPIIPLRPERPRPVQQSGQKKSGSGKPEPSPKSPAKLRSRYENYD